MPSSHLQTLVCQQPPAAQEPSISQNLFSRRLFALGFQREHTWTGNIYRGIGLEAALSAAELPYVDIGINLPADSSPQQDHSNLITTFNTALAQRSHPKPPPLPSPTPFSFPSSAPTPKTPASSLSPELAYLELLVQRELMTPIPGYPPSGSLPEASEASRGNPSAHPSNVTLYEDATSAENVLTPTHEASEASRGNPFNASLDTINEPYTVYSMTPFLSPQELSTKRYNRTKTPSPVCHGMCNEIHDALKGTCESAITQTIWTRVGVEPRGFDAASVPHP